MRDDLSRRLIAEVRAYGVTRYHIVHRGKHPQLRFEWQGQELRIVLPGTPSDVRSERNALACLRRMMGVVKRRQA